MKHALRKTKELISSLIGIVTLFSIASVVFYWIYAFLYFGGHGSFDGVVDGPIAILKQATGLTVTAGRFNPNDWRSVAYHALLYGGPGLITFPPSYLLLRLFESL